MAFFVQSAISRQSVNIVAKHLLKTLKFVSTAGWILDKIYLQQISTLLNFPKVKQAVTLKQHFTDTVGQIISESFGVILSNKIGTKKSALYAQSHIDRDVEDVNYPAIESSSDSTIVKLPEYEQLKQIFKEDNEKTSLLETRLKAVSKRDYGIRLTLLFLYYKHLSGIDNVHRRELTAILQDASVEDGNLRFWIGKNSFLGSTNNFVHIKAGGKDAAKQYMLDILNPEMKDKWQIGMQTRTVRKPKEKKEKVS